MADNLDISNREISNRGVSNRDLSNRGISNQDLSNRGISNREISNRGISNQDLSNREISNRGISNQGISNRDISNQDISNRGVSNRDLSNRDISNQDLSNRDLSNRDLSNRILYEDNHIIIVSKLVGEITQGDKTGDIPLGEDIKAMIAVRDAKPGAVFLGVPHRLDRPVSGVAMFAKTSKALERLNAMFREGQVHKTYWALVCQKPEVPEGYLEDYLYRIEKQNKSYVCPMKTGADGTLRPTRADAKLAKLRYRCIGHSDRYYLIEVELLTGRHHQIRCQLAEHLSPIKGDLKYGAPRSNPDGGICLHARRIEFIHPVRKTPITIEAPLPTSWPTINFEAALPTSWPTITIEAPLPTSWPTINFE